MSIYDLVFAILIRICRFLLGVLFRARFSAKTNKLIHGVPPAADKKLETRWSELNPDVLLLVAKKLGDISNVVRFRVVCKQWRCAMSPSDLHSIKAGMTQMLTGVIMDVHTPEHARIAEEAGAYAVVAVDCAPIGLWAQDEVVIRGKPSLLRQINNAVTIPVWTKARIHHLYDCHDLTDALRRIRGGASMIRINVEAGTGNVLEAVAHIKSLIDHEIHTLCRMNSDEVSAYARRISCQPSLVKRTQQLGRLPVPVFVLGGISSPKDVARIMQLGCDGVFVGSGIFESSDPARTARAIVQAVRDNDLYIPELRVEEGKGGSEDSELEFEPDGGFAERSN